MMPRRARVRLIAVRIAGSHGRTRLSRGGGWGPRTSAPVLQERLGLREVHLAPAVSGPEDILRRSLGRLTARVLRTHLRDGVVLGVADGAPMSALADALPEAPESIAA